MDLSSLKSNLLLRQSTKKDIPWITAFMQQHYPPAYAYLWEDKGDWYVETMYNAERLAREFAEPKAEFYQVMQADQCVGFCKLVEGKKPENAPAGRYFYVQRLYLSTAVQGQGIGRQVMEAVHERAKQVGCDYCWLETMEIGDARRFYERFGYVSIGKRRLPYQGMVEETRGLLILVKKLLRK